jgi:hypothetical protein
MTAKITEKENAIFKKVVDALQKHDTDDTCWRQVASNIMREDSRNPQLT